MTTDAAVVIGASIGGVRTVQALRRNGWTGRITLVDAEAELPYDRPPLSKAVLGGADPVRLLTEEQAKDLDVELRLGVPAAHLDVADRRVVLAGGEELLYQEVVVATGASARPSPWEPESGVHVLRSLADSRALRADLAHGGSVVVVGAGFIGAEVAAGCRALGHEVTVVDPVPVPMARVVGRELGARMVDLHHRHGTRTRFGTGVEDITGRRGDLTVHLTDGSELSAAVVVVGIGVELNDDWLATSGLALDDGVLCDALGRTSAPGVHALGDLARWDLPDGRPGRRIEHWTNAVDQAGVVAKDIVAPGSAKPHLPNGFVWSDQYDWHLHVVGAPWNGTSHDTHSHGEAEGDKFCTVFSDDDDLAGAAVVNWPAASVKIRRHLASGGGAGEVLQVVRSLNR